VRLSWGEASRRRSGGASGVGGERHAAIEVRGGVALGGRAQPKLYGRGRALTLKVAAAVAAAAAAAAGRVLDEQAAEVEHRVGVALRRGLGE
jgi:hypothetical protein